MKKLKLFIPSVIAIVAAVLVSLFLIEHTLVILSCLAVGMVALAMFVAVLVGRSIRAKHSLWRSLLSVLVPAVLFVAIASTHIPLRIIFPIYRAEFDRAAAQIEAGDPPATPFWIGPFKIEMVGRHGDSGPPYLSSNRAEWGIDGFVRHPEGQGFNLWSCITLDDEWSYIAED